MISEVHNLSAELQVKHVGRVTVTEAQRDVEKLRLTQINGDSKGSQL